MARTISIHSFRGGTGKSNALANLAVIMAMAGQRVAVIDTDIQSPGIHVLFGLTGSSLTYTLNHYLWSLCDIEDITHDVSDVVTDLAGKLYLIPASSRAKDIAEVLRNGYDINYLVDGMQDLVDDLGIDILLVDTHPGLNEDTLFLIAISHGLIIMMRPDQQDYEGTGVMIEVARSLEVPEMALVVNKIPALFDTDHVRERVEQTFNCHVAAVLPNSDEMMALASNGLFVLKYPDHPISQAYRDLAKQLMG